jgi:hypothetical protein
MSLLDSTFQQHAAAIQGIKLSNLLQPFINELMLYIQQPTFEKSSRKPRICCPFTVKINTTVGKMNIKSSIPNYTKTYSYIHKIN